MRLDIIDGMESGLRNATFIFLVNNSDFVPLKILDIQEGSYYTLYLDYISTPEECAKWVPSDVYLTKDVLIKEYKQASQPWSPLLLLNYTLFDGSTTIGKIVDVVEYPHQWMLTVSYASRQVLIPYVAAFIKEIHHDNASLIMDLPVGILDL